MQEHQAALDGHIEIAQGAWGDADTIKRAVKTTLRDGFGLSHITLEAECHAHACKDPLEVGHKAVAR